jgi:hypothetical protein
VFAAGTVGASVLLLGPSVAAASGLMSTCTAVVSILVRFASGLVWPRSPVLSFTPAAPPIVACAGLMLVLLSLATLCVAAWSRMAAGTFVAGAALCLAFPWALATTASHARSASDREAYVFLLGAVLVSVAIARAFTFRFALHVPPVAALGLAALVPLDAAYALDLRDETTVLNRSSRANDEEGSLARALLDPRSAGAGRFCAEYARSHATSTRAHGCVASALLEARAPEQALPWAEAYFRERPNRRVPRGLLIETFLALDRTAEAEALIDGWKERLPARTRPAATPGSLR